MPIVSAASQLAQPEATQPLPSQTIDQNQFMQLLIDQLSHQDPMKPMDDSAFVTQLAQFSALEEMRQLHEAMTSMATDQQIGQAAALIGKTVEGIDAQGQTIAGSVSGVTVKEGIATLLVRPADGGAARGVELADVEKIT